MYLLKTGLCGGGLRNIKPRTTMATKLLVDMIERRSVRRELVSSEPLVEVVKVVLDEAGRSLGEVEGNLEDGEVLSSFCPRLRSSESLNIATIALYITNQRPVNTLVLQEDPMVIPVKNQTVPDQIELMYEVLYIMHEVSNESRYRKRVCVRFHKISDEVTHRKQVCIEFSRQVTAKCPIRSCRTKLTPTKNVDFGWPAPPEGQSHRRYRGMYSGWVYLGHKLAMSSNC